MKNVYGAFRAFSRTLGDDETERIRREVLRDRSGLLDDHPCPLRRIARVRTVHPVPDPCEESARTIFESPEVVEEEVSAILAENLVGGPGLLEVLRQAKPGTPEKN